MPGIGDLFAGEADVSPNSALNKILFTLFGTAGMIASSLVAIALSKIDVGKDFFDSDVLKQSNKMLTFVKTAWDTFEPALRIKFPKNKEKFYWVDQSLDWIKNLIGKDSIKSLFE